MYDPYDLLATSIPPFNHEGMLPPVPSDFPCDMIRSPYPVSMMDLILRFGTSPQRCNILRGFIRLRHMLFSNSFKGFQWIDGSFVERLPDREPNDIDVVSFVDHSINSDMLFDIMVGDKLISSFGSKEEYLCDSYMVDMSIDIPKIETIEATTYWFSLFSHTRESVWKGMLKIGLPESYKEFDFFMAMVDWRQKYEPNH